jgi:uncharacterized protein YjbI with pentapeptide repeats
VPTDRRSLHGGLANDIAAALAALRRGTMIHEGAWSESERVNLRDAELDGLAIPRVCFADSNFEGAHFVGAKLADATLSDTVLRKTDLSGADPRGADLTRADLSGAILLGADLTKAKLRDANLIGVIADHTTTGVHATSTGPTGCLTREGGTTQPRCTSAIVTPPALVSVRRSALRQATMRSATNEDATPGDSACMIVW